MRGLKYLLLAGITGIATLGTAQAEITLTKIDSVPIPAATAKPAANEAKVYIVQMKSSPIVAYEGDISGYRATKAAKGNKINPNSAHVKKYANFLDANHSRALSSVGVTEKIYDYRYALNGFAALLTPVQAAALKTRDDVQQVWLDEIRQLTTNSTPDYLDLTGEGGVWDLHGKGEDVIVGVIDTGITPEHPSFSDQIDLSNATGSSGKRTLSYGSAPAGWHGDCISGEQWSQDDCNNKLIGARWYVSGFSAHGASGILPSEMYSARDTDGHGSHTASTAAGNEGPINTLTGQPISGIAPRARVAAYKVCWEGGCAGADSAAAIDQAVADGVDVINFSIGGGSTVFAGPDDIAFLFAADAGVFVATSNGNSGPDAQTTGTPAGVPWITSVGATQDNEVVALSLEVTDPVGIAGDYLGLEGGGDVSFTNTGDIAGPIVSAAPHNGCAPLTNGSDIAGNIALIIRGACAFTDKYNNAAAAGATAIVVYNDGADSSRIDPIVMSAPGTTIPGIMISHPDGALIDATAGAAGLVGPGTQISQNNRIAGFSSRGPNGGALDVIKPDVSAPGVNIIAAGAGANSFIRISGTSMASPHVAGAFALLKGAHPNWSAAMAKSALMTSGRQDLKKTFGDAAADPFDIGAGHIVPSDAFSPGLVYNAGFFDYLAFSCDNNVQLVSDGSCAFLEGLGFPTDGSDLNLASIGIADFVGSQTVTRTVTSVTDGTTNFSAVVEAPSGVDVVVTPDAFGLAKGDSQEVSITFSANANVVAGEWTFGSLTWANDDANASPARSPIAIRPLNMSVDGEVSASGTSGSVDINVEFGFEGNYSAVVSGISPASVISSNVSAAEGLEAFCVNLPAMDHIRMATFDEDTTTPGADDIDIRVFLADDCGGNNIAQIAGSGGATSVETIDVANAPAGGYFFVIDYFAAAVGDNIDYKAFIHFVLGDDGNTSVTAPASATLGATDTVTVDYGPLSAGNRHLGIVSHQDDSGEVARTIISVDTQ